MRGAGRSFSARPVSPTAPLACTPASPYGAGARANTSCQNIAFAGNSTIVSLGTTMVCPWTLTRPPHLGLAVQVGSSVASWISPTMSNCVDAGIGSCARADPAASITSAATADAERNTTPVLNPLPIPMISPGGALAPKDFGPPPWRPRRGHLGQEQP